MKFINANELLRKSGAWGTQDLLPVKWGRARQFPLNKQ
jgi:hypothetical protein